MDSKPNILFIVIDSLRSDKAYGNSKSSLTPNLDLIIKNGILFSNTVSVAPSTAVSLASIITGLYPYKIGMSDDKYQKLDSDIPNFITALNQNGYTTHVSASEINDLLGITTDFDLKSTSTNYRNYFGLSQGFGQKLIEKISSDMKTPWFYYIHFYDLHEPIIVPSDFDNPKYGISNYDKMISAIDFWLGKILEIIDIKKTLVVITADHGDYVRSIVKNNIEINLESSGFEKLTWKIGNNIPLFMGGTLHRIFSKLFQSIRYNQRKNKINQLDLSIYEKRVLETSRMNSDNHLFDDLLLVPLIFYGSNISKHNHITNQVRSVDIFPTIFDLCKLTWNNELDGTSLNPLINDVSISEKPTYVESMPSITNKNDKMIGVRTSKFKYICSKKDHNIHQLYDLINDPHEEINVASNHPEVVKEMETILNELIIQPTYKTKILEKNEREKIESELRKLGYV